jgi:3-deoxy-D-manno-octulosonic-acid transferase
MESTAMGKCTIFGPETFNFKQTVDALLAKNGAIEVRNEKQLLEQAAKCLSEAEYADTIAANGRKVIIENQGATQKTVDAIISLINLL